MITKGDLTAGKHGKEDARLVISTITDLIGTDLALKIVALGEDSKQAYKKDVPL